MAFDQATRNRLQKFVGDARKLLSEEFTQQLQNTYGLDPVTGGIAELSALPALSPSEQQTAILLRDTLEHYLAASQKADPHKDKALVIAALDRIMREQAFTVLNRLAALRMAEARQFVMESISQGYQSKGFQLYQRIAGSSLGETGQAYQHYLFSVFDELSLDLAVLFDRYSSQGRFFPRETVLLELLDLINHAELEMLWAKDETVGWIYQYFNSIEERRQMRAESAAPRNSRELAVRNQFFTPRYVVEFLTDNTLGRIWYEMTQGNTALMNSCKYLVRRPNEIFLKPGEPGPAEIEQEELLQQTVYIQHRPIKDPRDIKMLDPACGSMHFGLYAFDLFELIYIEAWDVEANKGREIFLIEEGVVPRDALHEAYPSKEEFLADVPRLIIEHNIHGVDIDPRAAQIAGLSLWLRAQKSWSENTIKPAHRPQIQRSNIVCAEPMPGEIQLLKEFTRQIRPRVLGQLVEDIFDKMQLAGEAGTLLKIEEEIQFSIEEAKSQKDENVLEVQGGFFGGDKWEVREGKRYYNFGDVGDDFWGQAEQLILAELERYAESATGYGSGQKRLFASDAAKGFSFIDLCKKRFDVVLMNPPFGEMTARTSAYSKTNYKDEKDDIGTAFVARGGEILSLGGRLGAITNRTYLSIPTAKNWRNKYFLGGYSYVSEMADLGYGVLDDAMVEAAAYVLSRSKKAPAAFFNILESVDKQDTLELLLTSPNKGQIFKDVDNFKIFPGNVICHWLPNKFFDRLRDFSSIESALGKIKTGLNTGDDFRFLRLVWELDLKNLGAGTKKWALLSKGGEYSAYSNDFHMAINWQSVNRDMRDVSGARIFNENDAFLKGVVYPMRTTSDLSPRALPENVVFNKASQFLPVSNIDEAKYFIALAYTRSFKLLVEAMYGSGDTSVAGSAARNYTGGVLNTLPIPKSSDDIVTSVSKIYDLIVGKQSSMKALDEVSLLFNADTFLKKFSNDIRKSAREFLEDEFSGFVYVGERSFEIDQIVAGEYNFDERFLETSWGKHPFDHENQGNGLVKYEDLLPLLEAEGDDLQPLKGTKRIITKKSYFSSREIEVAFHVTGESPSTIASMLLSEGKYLTDYEVEYSKRLLSCLVGKAFGRWHSSIEGEECSSLNFADYNINKIQNDYLVTETLSVIDSDQLFSAIRANIIDYIGISAESFESQFCDVNNLPSFEDYFVSPRGFFDWHLTKYSNSRRQAPVYWPIQSASGEVVIWLYYHALSDETLFSCVNNIVDPKLQALILRAEGLEHSVQGSKTTTKEYVDIQERIEELSDFRDELLEISKNWKPKHDDGVLINAAPLWTLFKHNMWQSKLKKTWKELEKGKYDWSFMAMSYWPERVLKRCKENLGFAKAHSLEGELWESVEVGVGRGIKVNWQSKGMADAELELYIQKKIAQG